MARFLRRQVTYALRPPVVFPPAATALSQPVQTHLSRAPRQARQSRYVLHPSATLVQSAAPFLASPPQSVYRTATKRATEQRPVNSTIFPPEIIDPPRLAPPLRQTFVRAPRQSRATHVSLRPPTVTGAVVAGFIAAPDRLSFRIAVRRATEQHFVTSTLFPPEIVDAVPPFRALQTVYATATRRAVEHHGSASRLRPPTVVSPAASGDNPVGSVFDPNYFLLIHP